MEQHVSQNNERFITNNIHFFYLFIGLSTGFTTLNLSNFGKQISYIQLVILIVNIVFLFTPLWKKIFSIHMKGNARINRRQSILMYLVVYIAMGVSLISQITAIMKSLL